MSQKIVRAPTIRFTKKEDYSADPAKLHPPRHHGTHFDVSSYLPFPRSPQGHPFLAQAGSSPTNPRICVAQ